MTPSGSSLIRYAVTIAGFGVMIGCHRVPRTPWPGVVAPSDSALLIGEVSSIEDGRPVEAAFVQLIAVESGLRDSVRTNESGRFVLGPLPPGSYHIRVSRIGYRALSQDAHLSAGAIDRVRLRLSPGPSMIIHDCFCPPSSQGHLRPYVPADSAGPEGRPGHELGRTAHAEQLRTIPMRQRVPPNYMQ
jgi:hypothetical protein